MCRPPKRLRDFTAAGVVGIASAAGDELRARGLADLADVLIACCERNPDLRPTAAEALAALDGTVRVCVLRCVGVGVCAFVRV